jgi:chaperonin cofactor prefoldin
MPIKLDFLANAVKFLRETDKVEDALDDVADAVDDMARDGDRGAERLERSFRDIANEARDTGRVIDREVGDVGSRGFSRLGSTGSEVAGELRQNLGETFSSFKGDLADLPQIAQDTLGGLAGSGALGGIPGLAITAAGAAGLGLITSTLLEQTEQADLLKQALASAYASAVEEGRAYLDEAQIIKGVNDLLFDPEQDSLYKQLAEDARTLGVDVDTMLRAQAGDLEALNVAMEAGKQIATDALDPLRTGVDLRVDEAAELGHALGRAEDLLALHEDNIERADRALGIEQAMGAEERGNHKRAKDALAERGRQLAAFYAQASKTPTPTIVPKVSTAEAERRLAELTRRKYEVTVGVRYANGKPVDR